MREEELLRGFKTVIVGPRIANVFKILLDCEKP